MFVFIGARLPVCFNLEVAGKDYGLVTVIIQCTTHNNVHECQIRKVLDAVCSILELTDDCEFVTCNIFAHSDTLHIVSNHKVSVTTKRHGESTFGLFKRLKAVHLFKFEAGSSEAPIIALTPSLLLRAPSEALTRVTLSPSPSPSAQSSASPELPPFSAAPPILPLQCTPLITRFPPLPPPLHRHNPVVQALLPLQLLNFRLLRNSSFKGLHSM